MSYSSLIQSAAQTYGVPPALLAWQINQESSGNPNAYNPQSGAAGIAQFIPGTAAQFGINPYDPTQAIPAAAQYDAQLYQQTGSWQGALTSYGTLANAPPSVMSSYQQMASANGIDQGGLFGWLGNFFNPNQPTAQALQQQGGAYMDPLGVNRMFGSSISKLEELAIRLALGAVGLAVVLAGFYLAGHGRGLTVALPSKHLALP